MKGTIADIAARMSHRKQRLEEDQARLDRKSNFHAQHPDAISEPSELESSRPKSAIPKPKRRQNRAANKSPFDDDSSLQFDPNDTRSGSSTATASTASRPVNKFIKKPAAPPATSEKITVTRSPRDAVTPRISKRAGSSTVKSSTGLLAQSSLLARAVHRQELHAKGIELKPGEFEKEKDDESSSDGTSNSASKLLFGANKKSFVKRTAANAPENQVPELQHLDSETNSSDLDSKKKRRKKSSKKASMIDTEDDSSLDILGDGSSSDGRKTPVFTPKSILKSPKDAGPKEIEYSVQFSENLITIKTEEDRASSPNKSLRTSTPRRVQINENPRAHDYKDPSSSETDSISTAIDIPDEDNDDVASGDLQTQSPVENMFANLIMNEEPLIPTSPRKRSPRTATTVNTNRKSHGPVWKPPRQVQQVTDEEISTVEDIPEELSAGNYSEDFTSGPTDTSTPRSALFVSVRSEKPPTSIKKVNTGDQAIQVDDTSVPFQSPFNQVHSIFLINQTDLNEPRPSSLIRSVVEPNVLQSLLTTNPVILAVDDLIREQTSLLRSFVQLQRTYYESTVRSIRPDFVYTTKDNTLRLIAEQKEANLRFQYQQDSIERS